MTPRSRRAAPRAPREQATAAILARIRALVAALQRSARSIEAHTGITNAQLFVLRQLATAETRSINELAALALTQQSTVSTVVARLTRRGLVSAGRSAEDGRRATVALTAAGRRLLRHAPKPPTNRLLDGLAALDENTLRALATGLAALTDAMNLPARGATMLFEENAAETSPTRRNGVRATSRARR